MPQLSGLWCYLGLMPWLSGLCCYLGLTLWPSGQWCCQNTTVAKKQSWCKRLEEGYSFSDMGSTTFTLEQRCHCKEEPGKPRWNHKPVEQHKSGVMLIQAWHCGQWHCKVKEEEGQGQKYEQYGTTTNALLQISSNITSVKKASDSNEMVKCVSKHDI